MKTLALSKNKFHSLEKYNLAKNILSTEAELFFLNKKTSNSLLKIFFIDEGMSFGNKLLTINLLIDAINEINIEELVLPEKLVIINNRPVGYSMKFIKNVNLKTILENPKVDIKTKVSYLKEVGNILEKVSKTTPYDKPFHLSDIHEANFLLNTDTNKINAVDLDSCKIGNNSPSPIRYISTNKNIETFTYKYQRNEQGIYVADNNSDIFSYIIMILNTISNADINKLPITDYYCYLYYLSSLGLSNELIDNFNNIYTGAVNESPLGLLDELSKNKNIYKANYKVYEMKKKQF